jgi:GTPase
VHKTDLNKESQTILIGLKISNTKPNWSCDDSMKELKELCKTAGLQVLASYTQTRENPDHGFYIGTGKLQELKNKIKELEIKVLVADDELSPTQYKNLERELKIKILDRTSLILDIFAKQARTSEAQLQVELAQLEYLLPRLTRLWTHLSRLAGGIGTKGPGEKQIESDKRQIRRRITTIKQKLSKIKKRRKLLRQKRKGIPTLTGTIVGYTNAGKSTLMNHLTKADIYAANKLFATLDPTTRHIKLPSNEKILLTDTVGFIQKLPHQVVSSFQSTLEEIADAHFILRVVDASHPNMEATIQTSSKLLEELHAKELPQLFIFNKIDQVEDKTKLSIIAANYKPHIFISALKNINLEKLLEAIDKMLASNRKKIVYHIPYNRMDIVSLIHENGSIISQEYNESIKIKANINSIIGEKIMGQLHQ